MIFLRNLSHFPPFYKERNKSINFVRIALKRIQPEDNSILFVANTNLKYETTIFVLDKNKRLLSPVQISCTCESFIYEFEYACQSVGSLYGSPKKLEKKPKVKNPYILPTGCKHIHALARLIVKKYI